MYGRILSSWHLTNETVEIEVEIPANTTAEILLPKARLADVLEGNKPLISGDIHSYMETIEDVRLIVGSGSYHFKYRNESGLRPSFTEDTPIIDFLDYQEAVAILEKFAPGITKPPAIFSTKARSLKELAELQEVNLTVDKVKAIIEELKTLALEAVLVE